MWNDWDDWGSVIYIIICTYIYISIFMYIQICVCMYICMYSLQWQSSSVLVWPSHENALGSDFSASSLLQQPSYLLKYLQKHWWPPVLGSVMPLLNWATIFTWYVCFSLFSKVDSYTEHHSRKVRSSCC